MPRIELKTIIATDNIELVFDLIRSIDLHLVSTGKTNEKAIAGKTSGLISLGETVTWRAKHLGVYQELTSVITDYNRPFFFADEMLKGAFKSFRHEHYLRQENRTIVVKDIFIYKSPYGFLGKLVDFLFLKNYMKRFLEERNKTIKKYTESGEGQEILNKMKKINEDS